jgi:hypothetical protein
MEVCGLDSPGSGQRQLTCFYKHGNENLRSVNGEELLASQEALSSIELFTCYFEIMWHQMKS